MNEKYAFFKSIPVKETAVAAVLSAAAGVFLWSALFSLPFLPIIFGISINIPVLFVLFSYGARSGLAAALGASLLMCIALPLSAAISSAVFFFIPAVFVGWLLGLTPASPAVKDTMAKSEKQTLKEDNYFYPLPAALFQLALAVAFVTIAVLFYSFSAMDSTRVFTEQTQQIIDFIKQLDLYELKEDNIKMQDTVRRLLPVIAALSLALYGFLFQIAALYCAMALSCKKKLLQRPLSYWPRELRMPPMALFLFIALWCISYFIDHQAVNSEINSKTAMTLALCFNIILAVLSAGFCASGLAVLHQVTRGGWLWLRLIIYFGLFSLVLTPLFFFGLVIMGLFATPFPPRKQSGNSPLP